jgi:hypothetical protein
MTLPGLEGESAERAVRSGTQRDMPYFALRSAKISSAGRSLFSAVFLLLLQFVYEFL